MLEDAQVAEEARRLRREMADVAAAMYASGAVLVLLSIALPRVTGVRTGLAAVLAALALVAAVGLLAASRVTALPVGVFAVMAAVGTVVTSGVVYAGGPDVAAAYGIFYVFVAAFCFYYLPSRLAALEVLLCAVAYPVALDAAGAPGVAAKSVVMIGGAVVAGGLIGGVGHRTRRLFERELLVVERLRDVDDMKNTFLAAVSHELRTPLTMLMGSCELLRRHGATLGEPRTSELLDRMVNNGHKLHRLLTDLLDVDRLARGVVAPHLAPVDLGELTRSVLVEMDLDGRNVTVDAPPVVVQADRAKIERILENLVGNVVRHTPPTTPVWVRIEHRPDGALLVVEDAGPGIDDRLKGSVFEPFRQGADATAAPSPGTGIGLSLVARFAQLHGGQAWVEDRPGGGARFCVSIPNAQVAEPV